MIDRIFVFCFVSLVGCHVAIAQEEVQDGGSSFIQVDPGDLDVPKGDVQDVAQYLRETYELNRRLSREYSEVAKRIRTGLNEAAAQALDEPANLSDEDFVLAARLGLAQRIRSLANEDANDTEKRAVISLVLRHLTIAEKTEVYDSALGFAIHLGKYLEGSNGKTLARLTYMRFANVLRESKNSNMQLFVERFDGAARRLGLLGNKLELSGKLLDGSEFDWSKYKSRVVLVHFWSSTSRTSVRDIPKFRELHKLYHDRGFDIVGVAVDSKPEPLRDYLARENVSWDQLYEPGKAMRHPLAVYYGVERIPMCWLVDRSGKVVSMNAHGDELDRKLELLLGPKDTNTQALAADGKWDAIIAKLKPKVESGEGGFRYQVGLAAAQILNGDVDEYAETCGPAWEKYSKRNIWEQAQVVRLCCLSQDSGIDPKQIRQVAQDAASKITDAAKHNSQRLARVMASFRAGEYEECWKDPFQGAAGDPVNRTIVLMMRAMSAHKLGMKNDAKKVFRTGEQVIKKHLSDFSGRKTAEFQEDHWIGCAIAQMMLQEANAVLGN